MSHPPSEVPMLRLSYNDIHSAIQNTAAKIKKEFAPTLFIAIGGGGFIPARILRTQLKTDVNGKKRNIPIQAVGLALYESMGGLGQNFSHGGLLGRHILIVDEVDDTRTTLMYTVRELQSDIEKQLAEVTDEAERERLRKETTLGIFVVHNKLKPKAGELPDHVAYFSAVDTPDVWLAYPWECDGDIDIHDALRSQNPQV
nr:transferase [Cryptococcus depauperatus CBS 7855]